MITLCNSLKFIIFFKEIDDEDATQAKIVLNRLKQFKFVCIFLADILYF